MRMMVTVSVLSLSYLLPSLVLPSIITSADALKGKDCTLSISFSAESSISTNIQQINLLQHYPREVDHNCLQLASSLSLFVICRQVWPAAWTTRTVWGSTGSAPTSSRACSGSASVRRASSRTVRTRSPVPRRPRTACPTTPSPRAATSTRTARGAKCVCRGNTILLWSLQGT